MFADTGKQFVTLKASGTPNTVGNYFFSVTKAAVKSFFPISVLKNEVQTEAVPIKSYFKGNIGGVPYYVKAPTISPDNVPYGRSNGDTVSLVSFVGLTFILLRLAWVLFLCKKDSYMGTLPA